MYAGKPLRSYAHHTHEKVISNQIDPLLETMSVVIRQKGEMRTNLGQAEDRKRTCEGPHRQKVQLYQIFFFNSLSYSKAFPWPEGPYTLQRFSQRFFENKLLN